MGDNGGYPDSPSRMTYQMSAHFDLTLYLPSDFTLQLSAAELPQSQLSRSASPRAHVLIYRHMENV